MGGTLGRFLSLHPLRPLRESDVEPSWRGVKESANEVGRWMPWCHPWYSLRDVKDWIEHAKKGLADRTAFEFAICGADDEFLGCCGLNQLRPVGRVANFGYWVRTSQTSRGIATRAGRALFASALGETDLIRFEILVAAANTRSCCVAEKLGAKLEGRLSKRLFLHGRSEDALMFALFRPE